MTDHPPEDDPRRAGHLGEPAGAWRALAACVLTLAPAAGARFAFSAFFQPIEADTGLDRLTLSLAIALSAFSYGAVLPIVGPLATRIGARPVLMGGALLMALSALGVVTARHAWQFYLFAGLLPGIGFGAAGHVPGAVLLARWFGRHLGMATGLLVGAIPAGHAVFVPLTAVAIEWYGWRLAYLLTGLLLAAIALPALWWWTREPPSEPERPERRPAQKLWAGRDVWLLAAGYVACGFTDHFVAFHFIALAGEAGTGAVVAAGLLSASLVAGLLGSVASGPLADAWSPRLILAMLYLTRAVAFPLLLLAEPGHIRALVIFVLLFGFTYIANQAPATRYVRDRYGVTAVGRVMGSLGLAHQLGAAAGIAAGGLSVRVLESYQAAVLGSALVALAGALTQYGIGPRTTRIA
jgi:predicted MFS family arabinose efflux permease